MSRGEWRPTATLATLRRRAALSAATRRFFAARGVLEVETPLLGRAPVTDPHIACPRVTDAGPEGLVLGHLQSSPEFAMKRLLAAGAGPIYQLCKAFRAGEHGRWHRLEFTILEWYRPGFDLSALMDEVQDLVHRLCGRACGLREPYAMAFGRVLSLDPHTAPDAVLRARAGSLTGVAGDALAALRRADLLDLLFAHAVQPTLTGVSMIHDYPSCQAALARVRPADAGHEVAARFEVFIDGVEVGNGFHELADPAEQRRRMLADLTERARLDLPRVDIDERFLAGLRQGIGDVAGVALGFDRLVAVALGHDGVGDVIGFPDEVQATGARQ